MAELLNRLRLDVRLEEDLSGRKRIVTAGEALHAGESHLYGRAVVSRRFGADFVFTDSIGDVGLREHLYQMFVSLGTFLRDDLGRDPLALRVMPNRAARSLLLDVARGADLQIDGGLMEAFRKAHGILPVIEQ